MKKILQKKNKILNVLQIDGGGIKGVIPITFLAKLEKDIGPLYKVFDLMTGTSTGSIICGCLSAGVSAKKLQNLYLKKGKELFDGRSKWIPWNLFRHKYDRKNFQEEILKHIGNISLKEVKTDFMAACFNLSSQRTHFIRSWYENNEDFKLIDVISWSALSAAYYFGKINVKEFEWIYLDPNGYEAKMVGASFQDGGQGVNNCTIGYILTELLAKKFFEYEKVNLISLGCGDSDTYIPYVDTCNDGFFNQILQYPFQARNEATKNQVMAGRYVGKHNGDINFMRINSKITSKMNRLDGVNYIDDYHKIGEKVFNCFVDDFFVRRLLKEII